MNVKKSEEGNKQSKNKSPQEIVDHMRQQQDHILLKTLVIPKTTALGFLDFDHYILIHWILRISWKLGDCLLYCGETLSPGYNRLNLWKRLLVADPNVGSIFSPKKPCSSLTTDQKHKQEALIVYIR